MSAYQLAIEIQRRWPEVVDQMGYEVGGLGVGERQTLAKYIANQLSSHIRDAQEAGHPYPIEGAFISNIDVAELRYTQADGPPVVSSLRSRDLSMYRLADPDAPNEL